MIDLKKIKSLDLFNLNLIADPRMSPAGDRVVFSVQTIDAEKNCYLSQLWLIELESNECRPLDSGRSSSRFPRWSPDGQNIAFLHKYNGIDQICLMNINSKEEFNLTQIPEGNIGSLSWSPSGEYISFTFCPTHPDFTKEAQYLRDQKNLSTPPRIIQNLRYRREGEGYSDTFSHLWRCRISDGLIEQLTEGEFDVWSPTWSPDSQWIAFLANQSPNMDEEPYLQDIWVSPAGGGALRKLETPPGYKSDLFWTGDGQDIVYVGTHTRDDPWSSRCDCLWVIPAAGGDTRCLTDTLDRPLENSIISDARASGARLAYTNNGRYFFLISDRGNCHLYTVVQGQDLSCLVGGNLDIAAVSSDAEGQSLVLLVSTPTQPAELFLTDGASGNIQQITRFNASWIQEIDLCSPEQVNFTGIDGAEIDGWLLRPSDLEPDEQHPLLLTVHGGPDMQYGNTFMLEFQLVVAQGYHVFYTNPRGSAGYGEDFANAIQGNWGGLDYSDLIAAADLAVSLPSVDPNRLAIAGGSYGGFMVAWTVSKTNRYCCAIAERGVYNRHSAAGTSDFSPLPDGYWPGNAWDRPERLWEQSPLRYAANIKTPLLLIQGEGDWRCPIEQAEQLFTALKRLDREVTFVRFPVEANHSLSRNGPPDLRLYRLDIMLSWLKHHFEKPA